MKVSDLIEKLQQMPDDLKVMVFIDPSTPIEIVEVQLDEGSLGEDICELILN